MRPWGQLWRATPNRKRIGHKGLAHTGGVNSFLTPGEQKASFGVNTGISFALGNLFTYATKCNGFDDDPDGCDDIDAPYPLCTNTTECNGAQYQAPVGDSNCPSEDSSSTRISNRVILTNPVQANASETRRSR